MKDKILQSNVVIRYKINIFFFTVLYVMVMIVSYLMIVGIGDEKVLLTWLIVVLLFGLVFLPFIGYYLTKFLSIIKNINKYKSYSGVITSVDTPLFIRVRFRHVMIKVDGFDQLVYARVYPGNLYDEVAKNIKVEIAYIEGKNQAIILQAL